MTFQMMFQYKLSHIQFNEADSVFQIENWYQVEAQIGVDHFKLTCWCKTLLVPSSLKILLMQTWRSEVNLI